MTKTDWTPDSQPIEEADPFSATGMFLSALGKESDQPQKQSEENAAQPVVRLDTRQPGWPAEQAPSAPATPATPATPARGGAQQGSPGEFTRLFQAAQPPRAVSSEGQEVQLQAPSAEPKQAPPTAPGEFTRIFVKPVEAKPAERIPAPPARAIPEAAPVPHPAPGSPRLKGFSSGASDSASAEGGATQFFQPRPSAPAPAPVPRVQAYTPPTPVPAPPAEEFKWPQQPEVRAIEGPVDPGAGSTSVTGLFASLGSAGQRQEEIKAQPAEPLPSFFPAPAAAPSGDESGSVTRLIQRLSEGVRTTPPVEAAPPPAASTEPPSPALDTGPGEFTRMISAGQFQAPAVAPVQPAVAPPPPPAPAFSIPTAAPPLPMPHAPAMAMPAAPRPAAAPAPPPIPAPRIELPKVPVPKPAPPALAAPAGKFQEMVPILLVVNTFLLIVLIVLVAFALKAR